MGGHESSELERGGDLTSGEEKSVKTHAGDGGAHAVWEGFVVGLEIFAKRVRKPNYGGWFDANKIGMAFI